MKKSDALQDQSTAIQYLLATADEATVHASWRGNIITRTIGSSSSITREISHLRHYLHFLPKQRKYLQEQLLKGGEDDFL